MKIERKLGHWQSSTWLTSELPAFKIYNDYIYIVYLKENKLKRIAVDHSYSLAEDVPKEYAEKVATILEILWT